jgi:uncharacterized protein (UPF0548 family)
VFSIGKPSGETMRRFLAAQSKLDFSYSAIGATANTPPSGYVVDHTRTQLGEGAQVFEAAKAALKRWEHFQFSWLEAGPVSTPIEVDAVVTVMAHQFGFWWLNAARIIAVIDEEGPIRRFGFAYGTLPDHAESGEERFCIEWHESDNSVWYDILAFSRPRHFLARLGYPVVRRIQKRFGKASSAAMKQAVRASR